MLLFIGCGSGGSSASQNNTTQEQSGETNSISEIKNLNSAVNNLGNNIEKDFDSFTIKIESSNELEESDSISNDTKAVYGTINGQDTKALLKLNSNYNNGYAVVKVYNENVLVGQSEEIKLDNSISFDFGSIKTN